MNDDRWLSVAEIAEHLGIKPETVYVWVADKSMPAHKVGRLWKFQKPEVDEWVRSGKAAPARNRKKRKREK
jgi:excisionase family DNA binding protein